MNKAELIARVAHDAKVPKIATESILNTILDTIVKTVKNGQTVRLIDFGTFCIGKRRERRGINPQTGKEMTIPKKKLPKFKPGQHFKNQLK